MHRFFVPTSWIQQDTVTFQDTTACQLTKVLRVKIGEQVIALNNEGDEYLCKVIDIGSTVPCAILKKQRSMGEPSCRVELFFPLSQREKVEWMLQKCTEIGVERFVPFTCARSLVQDEHVAEAKMVRWRTILREAAEQSGRGFIPELAEPKLLTDLITCSHDYEMACLAWENEKNVSLNDLLGKKTFLSMAVMIGPEGGFREDEVMQLVAGGWKPFTLGKRILRLETAAIVACALVINKLT